MIYYLTNEKNKESCPFNLILLTPDQIRNPATHMKLVVTHSECIVDMAASLPTQCLPISTEVVRVVPSFGKAPIWTEDILSKLMHMYPTQAPGLRRAYAYGEEIFKEFIDGMSKEYLWDNTITAYLSGG